MSMFSKEKHEAFAPLAGKKRSESASLGTVAAALTTISIAIVGIFEAAKYPSLKTLLSGKSANSISNPDLRDKAKAILAQLIEVVHGLEKDVMNLEEKAAGFQENENKISIAEVEELELRIQKLLRLFRGLAGSNHVTETTMSDGRVFEPVSLAESPRPVLLAKNFGLDAASLEALTSGLSEQEREFSFGEELHPLFSADDNTDELGRLLHELFRRVQSLRTELQSNGNG